MCAQSSTVRCVEMVDCASPFGVDHKWRWVKQISAARSINRRHSQTWPKRSLKYLARRCSCLFNGASLFFSSSSTHRQKLIQYLFRVRASQNYHHPLCATCKGPSPKKRKNFTFYYITLSSDVKRERWWKFDSSSSDELENHRHLFGVGKQKAGTMDEPKQLLIDWSKFHRIACRYNDRSLFAIRRRFLRGLTQRLIQLRKPLATKQRCMRNKFTLSVRGWIWAGGGKKLWCCAQNFININRIVHYYGRFGLHADTERKSGKTYF